MMIVTVKASMRKATSPLYELIKVEIPLPGRGVHLVMFAVKKRSQKTSSAVSNAESRP